MSRISDGDLSRAASTSARLDCFKIAFLAAPPAPAARGFFVSGLARSVHLLVGDGLGLEEFADGGVGIRHAAPRKRGF